MGDTRNIVHFINSVRFVPGTFSCAVDCFLEIWLQIIANQFSGVTRSPDDDGESIKFSIWGDHIDAVKENVTYNCKSLVVENYYGIRLATTLCTEFVVSPIQYEIDWTKHDIEPSTTTLCCPIIDSVKVNRESCTISWWKNLWLSNLYKHTMFVKRCKKTNINVEFTLSDKLDETEQNVVTAFSDTLKHVVDMTDKYNNEIEALLLELNWIKKKVVTSMCNTLPKLLYFIFAVYMTNLIWCV